MWWTQLVNPLTQQIGGLGLHMTMTKKINPKQVIIMLQHILQYRPHIAGPTHTHGGGEDVHLTLVLTARVPAAHSHSLFQK